LPYLDLVYRPAWVGRWWGSLGPRGAIWSWCACGAGWAVLVPARLGVGVAWVGVGGVACVAALGNVKSRAGVAR
jgi:hypothetical protein